MAPFFLIQWDYNHTICIVHHSNFNDTTGKENGVFDIISDSPLLLEYT